MRGPEKEEAQFPPTNLEDRKGKLSHEEQLGLYTTAKQQSESVAQWMVQHCPEFVKQAERLKGCASWLVFHDFFRLGKVLLRGGCTCKQHLLCAPCALRRSASYTKAYYLVISHLLSQHPDWVPVLITKTIRNSPDLADLFEQFQTAHRHLIQRRRDASKGYNRLQTITCYASSHGGVGSYEYKRGKGSAEWHPHSHEIALLSKADWEWTATEVLRRRKVNGKSVMVVQTVIKPLEFEDRLSGEWSELTGGSWVVDVRQVEVAKDADGEDDLYNAVAETMSYALKAQDLTPADQVYAYTVLRRRRLTYTYGCLRNVDLPPDAYDQDDTIPDDEPWVEREYRWWSGRYNLTEVRKQADALLPEPSKIVRSSKRGRPVAKVTVITQQSVRDFLRGKK